MTYDKDIPDFALQPAKELDEEDAFDPSPYDRLLKFHSQKNVEEQAEKFKPEMEVDSVSEAVENSIFESVIKTVEEPVIVTAPKSAEALSKPIGAEASDVSVQPVTMAEPKEVPVQSVTMAEPKEVPVQSITMAEPKEVPVQPITMAEPKEVSAQPIAVAEPKETLAQEATGILIEPKNSTEVDTNTILEDTETISEPNYDTASNSELETIEEAKTVMAEPTQEEAMTLLPNSEAAVIIPTAGTLVTNELKMTDIREKSEIRVYVEEDILVPDTKEDLASILSMTGNAKLSDSEIRVGQMNQDSVKVTGEVELHTLYIPENYEGEHHIINIQSRLPFKTDWNVSTTPDSRLVIKPHIESIDYTVINERKFRAKLTVKLNMREYANVEMQVFQGIKGEKLQLLKEKIQMTHVSERKTDVMDINETFTIKDTQPKPERILKYDIDIVENHKQITDDKAVINATIYCNILYLGNINDAEVVSLEEKGINKLTPQLYQGKTEFTQFIPIMNCAEGSKIAFNCNGLNVRIKEGDTEESLENTFVLEGDVETSIEIYKNLEREIVTDIYHRTKDIVCDKVELEAMSLGGSGVTEAAVREIINVPEKYGEVKKVIYIYGDIKNTRSFLEQNKNIVEGVVDITLLCLPEDDAKTAFSLNKEVNFRGSMEIPMDRGDTKANSEIAIKELWFDRINAKQIEVNANLFISSSVYGQDKYQVIQNVCFVEAKEEPGTKPGMVVYITKDGDTLWNIAKKYRTTMGMITEINELEEEQSLAPGKKLLIVK